MGMETEMETGMGTETGTGMETEKVTVKGKEPEADEVREAAIPSTIM